MFDIPIDNVIYGAWTAIEKSPPFWVGYVGLVSFVSVFLTCTVVKARHIH